MTTHTTAPADLNLAAWDLDKLEDHAARAFATYTLRAFLPTEQQGDMSREWQERADEARDLWLAVQAERARRAAVARWVIECWRCSNTSESFESSMPDARKDFDRQGWTYDDGTQLCPQCNGVRTTR